MVLNQITYYPLFGIPLIVYLGILTILFLIATSVFGALTLKGKMKFTYHKITATITIIFALMHGTLAVLAYF
jgi:hypothetical protein